MANSGSGYRRWIAMGILVPLGAWLVYRNLLSPEQQRVAASLPRFESRGSAAASSRNPVAPRARPAPAEESRRQPGQPLSQQELVALDPTLREDLLERSRSVKYQSSSRNIFQVYTPPPPPAPPPTPRPSNPTSGPPTPPPPPPPPPAAAIPLKFYGVAAPPGSTQKKAFLTDGEEIFIAQEGEVIAKFYKVVRIGVNTIELEDSRSKQRASVPLQEE